MLIVKLFLYDTSRITLTPNPPDYNWSACDSTIMPGNFLLRGNGNGHEGKPEVFPSQTASDVFSNGTVSRKTAYYRILLLTRLNVRIS